MIVFGEWKSAYLFYMVSLWLGFASPLDFDQFPAVLTKTLRQLSDNQMDKDEQLGAKLCYASGHSY